MSNAMTKVLDTNNLYATIREVPYPGERANQQAYREARQNYNMAVGALVQQWKQDYLFAPVLKIGEFTQPVLEAIYTKAYTEGHSAGYHEVENYFYDFLDFARTIRNLSV